MNTIGHVLTLEVMSLLLEVNSLVLLIKVIYIVRSLSLEVRSQMPKILSYIYYRKWVKLIYFVIFLNYRN